MAEMTLSRRSRCGVGGRVRRHLRSLLGEPPHPECVDLRQDGSLTDVQPQDEHAVWRPSSDPNRVWHRVVAVAAALVAVVARLVPVLRGGGLFGLGNYDDGVYYAAGTALLHGLIPYRDYLFLHPPGIVLLLAPFGLAGHDPTGLATARLAW